jgi:hypothetical protein
MGVQNPSFGSALNLNVNRHMVLEGSSEQPRYLSYPQVHDGR